MGRHVYTDDERRQVLAVLALNSGNVDRTLEQFEGDDDLTFPVPAARTVRGWRDSDDYAEIRDRLERVRDERHAEEMSDLLQERIELLRMAHQRLREKLEADEVPARDLASLDRNLATSAGILNQNSRINREKPLGIVETHTGDVDELWRSLEQSLGRRVLVVDGTVEDAPALEPPTDNLGPDENGDAG